MWLILAIVLVGLPFLSAPGRYVADTRDAVWFSPSSYLAHAFSLWRASPVLGNETHEGLAIPMGFVVGLIRGVGLPVWVTERLWHGLLLFIAGAGMVSLIDTLRGSKSVVAPLTAAFAYILTPYTFGYGLPTSGVFLPYVLLPFLLVTAARGLSSTALMWPALFGITTFLMGGANGAPQFYVLVPVGVYALWRLWADRSTSGRRLVTFTILSGAFFVGLNAYWLFLLSGGEISNVLAFSEQPKVINVTSSYSESIRSLGYWQFYGGNQFGPWVPTVGRFITTPAYILAGFALPIGALLSAWLLKWRYRLLFLFLMIASVVVMAGVFPVGSSTPFGRLMLVIYDHVPGAAGFRTTYKFAPVLALSVAVLVGVGLEEALARLRAADRSVGRRFALAGLAIVVLAMNGSPLWTGALYDGGRTSTGVPAYWQHAITSLVTHQDGYRAFFAPGTSGATYRWGTLHDGIAEAFPEVSSVHPSRSPVGEHYGSNLLTAIERVYQTDVRAVDSAPLFRYLGVSTVVLQNDLDWAKDQTARPAELQNLARDTSLEGIRGFGSPGQNVLPTSGSQPDNVATTVEAGLRPVQLLTVPNADPVVRAESGPPVVVSGDGFGIANLASSGMLDDGPPILYSGALTPQELAPLLTQNPSFVITDTNRRRFWSFSSVRRNYSYTLPAHQSLTSANGATEPAGGREVPGFGLFGGRVSSETLATYQGVSSISASGYGSVFQANPEFRPVNAFDRNPKTAWLVGGFGNPVGSWVQVNFLQPMNLSHVDLTLPNLGFGREVRRARLEFSSGGSIVTDVHPGTTGVSFPSRATSFLRVRIMSVSGGQLENPVGFSEIGIPGVAATEILQTPTDVFDTAKLTPSALSAFEHAPLMYLFQRAQTDAPLGRDEEVGVVRRFTIPVVRPFDLAGTVHIDAAASDDTIDRLLAGPSDIRAVSSSRFLGNPALRASAALDGDPHSAWVPQGRVGEWLRVTFPQRTIGRLSVQTQWFPGRTPITGIRVAFSDGSIVTAKPSNLEGLFDLRFRRRNVSSLTVFVTAVAHRPEGRNPPVGISEISIPSVTPVGRPHGRTPCFRGATFSLDGRPLAVQVHGTVEQLLAGEDLPVSTCGDRSIFLAPGSHLLFAEGLLQPDLLSLTTHDASLPTTRSPSPATKVRELGSGYDVDVSGASAPFYLVIGQNWAPGWTASIDGRSLGAPLIVDGYSAGWLVTTSGSFLISVRYGPQRSFDLALLTSLAALFVTLLVVAISALRRRRR